MPKWTPGGDTSVGGGKYLTNGDDGNYHMYITAAKDGGTRHNGEPFANAFFQIECEVVAGTVDRNVGKTWDNVFFLPKLEGKDGGKFGKKIIDRFLRATSLFTTEQLEDVSQELDFNSNDLVGRQFLVKLVSEEGKDGKKYIQINFADTFHPDDVEVKDWPKNLEYLKPSFFPPEWRLDPSAKKATSPPKPPVTKPKTDEAFI